jgi:hypothetical protein
MGRPSLTWSEEWLNSRSNTFRYLFSALNLFAGFFKYGIFPVFEQVLLSLARDYFALFMIFPLSV